MAIAEGDPLLSRLEALSEISDGELTVEYALKISDTTTELRAEPLKLACGEEGMDLFERNYFGNRLSITLGPIVRSNTFRKKRGRKRFRGRNWVFDLRETDGKFEIAPGESITVNSIEYVEVGPRLGALTMSRLTHATAGVVLSPSYIDPLWSGILVYEMTNVSSQPFTLHVGEKIGACHFYKVGKTDLSPQSTRKFADKSHHFGQNWTKILTGDGDPFPQKKLPVGVSDDGHFGGGWLRRNWKTLLNFAGVTAVVGVLVGIGATIPEIAEIRQTPARIAAVSDAVDSLKEDALSQTMAGSVVIDVPANNRSASRTIDVPLSEGQKVAAVLAGSPSGSNSGGVGASIVGADTDSVEIEITATLPENLNSATRVSISYVIILE